MEPREHVPPRILVDSIPIEQIAPLLPLDHTTSFDLSAKCHCEIKLTVNRVEETDPTVALVARWFVDYDPNVPSSLVVRHQQTAGLEGTFDSNLAVRGPVEYHFEPDSVGIAKNDANVHLIDVVIGETAGFDDNATTLPFRTMLSGYEATAYRFAVQLHVPQTTTCSGDKPATRTCL